MQYQPANLIIVLVALCIYKLLSQKGTKSMVMFIMFMAIVAAVPLAIIASIISARLSLGDAMSFKLIGADFNKAPNFKGAGHDGSFTCIENLDTQTSLKAEIFREASPGLD